MRAVHLLQAVIACGPTACVLDWEPTGHAGGSCGNGVIDAGEQCDDANDVSGDGCSQCSVNLSDDCPPLDSDLRNTPSWYAFAHPQTHHCYVFVGSPFTDWSNNADRCSHHDGTLAAPTNAEELDYLWSELGNASETQNGVWLGAQDVDGNANGYAFEWVTGEAWDPALWGVGEPNDINSKLCVFVAQRRLVDFKCGFWSIPAVCERPPPGDPTTP